MKSCMCHFSPLKLIIVFLTSYRQTLACHGSKSYYHDCKEVLISGYSSCSGVYSIKPDSLPPFDVYCDMETAGGGWTVIQRRMDGSVDFNRKWKDYVVGFGDLNGEFWLGLSKIHRLIESAADKATMKLWVDLQYIDGHIENATFSSFQIHGPSTGYNLTFTEHSGSNLASLNDSHKNMKFSTDDVDNDLDPTDNCASEHKGGWWYNECYPSRFNAPYVNGDELDTVIDTKLSFIFSELKLRQVYTDCKEAYDNGKQSSGIYSVNPDGQHLFEVYCDMETDGGGWTVFQRRQDGREYFYRSWAEYEQGFGNLKHEFWLGLNKIHPLTTASGSNQLNTLRIDLGDHEGNKGYAMYSTFKVLDSSTKYTLNIGGYSSGPVNVGNGMAGCNGMKFTTRDSDNDFYSSNCAEYYRGAWWYNGCCYANLNGVYGSSSYAAAGTIWPQWKGWQYSLKFTEMKVRRH